MDSCLRRNDGAGASSRQRRGDHHRHAIRLKSRCPVSRQPHEDAAGLFSAIDAKARPAGFLSSTRSRGQPVFRHPRERGASLFSVICAKARPACFCSSSRMRAQPVFRHRREGAASLFFVILATARPACFPSSARRRGQPVFRHPRDCGDPSSGCARARALDSIPASRPEKSARGWIPACAGMMAAASSGRSWRDIRSGRRVARPQ